MVRKYNYTHEAKLTVRLLGLHEVTAQILHDQVQVMMPGAVITVADKQALNGVLRTWVEARVIARTVFTGNRMAHRLFREPAQRVYGAVAISGRQPGPTIHGVRPQPSPSGCGQLVVRLGCLVIVCDDRAAWESQDAGWREACEIGGTLWKMRIRQSAEAAERRARDKLTADVEPRQ